MCKCIISFVLFLVPLQVIAVDHFNASDLLDRYAKTQDQLQSFVIKSEDSSENSSSFGSGDKEKSYSFSELHFDGERISFHNRLWGGFATGRDIIPKDKAEYQSFLWDGDNYFQYSKSPISTARPHGIVRIGHTRKYAEKLICRGYSGAPLLGFFHGDDKRIDLVLREADTIDVENELEPIAGSLCYIVNATTPCGKYRVWLDPKHGYNIAKAEIRKETGDLMFGNSMGGKAKFSGSVENVRFEKVSEVWIPIEADIEINRIFSDGNFYKSVTHHKQTETLLNPNFELLASFVSDDIENGAEALVLDVPGILYIWQNGELIPNVDESVVDQLDKMTQEIIAGRCRGGVGHPGDSNSARLVSDNVTVSDLLAKYRASQDKLQSFIAEGRTKVVNHKALQAKGRSEEELCEFRYDGDRVSHRSRSWDGVFTTRESPAYKSFLWDGQWLMQYRKDSNFGDGQVFISKNDNRKEQLISKEYNGAALMGYCAGDYHRVDSIFAKAEAASLRDKTEQVGESQCYVIDTDTKRGKYTIWIDPDHGYNLAKVEVKKTKGDLFGDGETVKSNMYFSLINVRFEKVDDVWVPMEADMQLAKDDEINVWHHKRTKMQLNPDHNALGSFAADDIPNGTKVIIPALQAEYKWQNGKVVTKDGGDVKF